MDVVGFLFIAAIAYTLPGLAMMQWAHWEGLGRGARLLISVAVSMVVVPFVFAVLGGVTPIQPNGIGLLALTLGLAAIGWILQKTGRAPHFRMRARNKQLGAPNRLEWVLVALAVLAFSLLINLHRLEEFAHGAQGLFIPLSDEQRHLTVMISVARSGIPPHNYFFPDLPLVYYYWSQIFPAAIANQGLFAVSLARAFAFHAFLTTALFLGLIYAFLRWNARSAAARWFGLASVTVFSGFDYFVTMGALEWWQQKVVWLHSANEIFSLPALYFFAPQHLAGGLVFLLALFLWRNIQAPPAWKAGALGVLLGFTFGTSPFVFLGAALALLLWILAYRRALWNRRAILPAFVFIGALALGTLQQLLLTLSSRGHIIFNDFRVPLVESLLHAETPTLGVLDQILTWLGMPVVMFWIVLIDIGLPAVIYGVWVFQKSWRQRSIVNRLAVAYPALMFLVTVLLTDQNGGGNFSRRCLIPMQIVIALAAALALKDWHWPRDGWRNPRTGSILTGQTLRAFLGAYIVAVFAIAQSFSWIAWEQSVGQVALGCALRVEKPVLALGFGIDACPRLPDEYRYIEWLNQHAPTSALIVEERIPSLADRRVLLLERMRYVDPMDARNVFDFNREEEVTRPADLLALERRAAGVDVLAQALNSEYVRSNRPAIYLVARNGARSTLGDPVYSDAFVIIYSVSY
jgi:hypothetical protein